jgi:hypothetical protein
MIRLVFAIALCGGVWGAALGYAQTEAERVPASGVAAANDSGPIAPPASAPAAPTPIDDSKPATSPFGEAKASDATESRYIFSSVQDGWVRLDNRTGQVSFCSKWTVGWACQLVPDDRGIFESEIVRLQEENAALKKDLATRGPALPGAVKPNSPAPTGDRSFAPLNDPNLDRMRTFIAKAWRRLVYLVANIQKDALKKADKFSAIEAHP